MPRKKSDEATNGMPVIEATVEALPMLGPVAALAASASGESVNGHAVEPLPVTNGTGSTLPQGERKGGERPWQRLGPVSLGDRATLSVGIWKKDVQVEEVVAGGEVKTVSVPVFNVALTRTYFADGQPKTSATLPTSAIPIAVMMLEKAERICREFRGNGS